MGKPIFAQEKSGFAFDVHVSVEDLGFLFVVLVLSLLVRYFLKSSKAIDKYLDEIKTIVFIILLVVIVFCCASFLRGTIDFKAFLELIVSIAPTLVQPLLKNSSETKKTHVEVNSSIIQIGNTTNTQIGNTTNGNSIGNINNVKVDNNSQQ